MRVVFFGPPRSGKSRLLDAVAAVARSQSDESVPLVPVTSPPSAVVRRRVTIDLPGLRAVTGDVEFIDCDGRAAQELLADADQLRRARERSELAASVRSTDALVVVIDATSPPEQVDEVFAQLDTFLKVLRDQRATDREVGGLPVFLVLGKCDELARRGEQFTDWQRRVEEEKEKLETRFRDWFEDTAGPFLAFGSTELTVAATATSWPDVLGGIADMAGGFGVDELHSDVLRAAQLQQRRSVGSRRRLSWTAGMAVGLLSLMLLSLAWLASTRELAAVDALADRVRRIQRTAGPPEVRLAEEHFERNRRELTSVQQASAFEQIPPNLQLYVEQELRQFAEYERYRRRFDSPQFSPADIRTASERAELEANLESELAPPSEFAHDWEQTEAVRVWSKWRTDLRLLADAEREVNSWYTSQLARLTELQLADVPSDHWTPGRWRAAVSEAVSRQPPHPPERPLAGSPALPVPRGDPLTWAAAYRFERSVATAEDWRQAAIRLADVRDLADAVGFTPHPVDPEGVLDLPTPGDAKQPLSLAVDRLARLRERYPRAVEGRAAWKLTGIPGSLRDVLGKRLKAAAANGVDTVRQLIAADPAANGDWGKLAKPDGLLSKPELASWGQLLRLLIGWAYPERPGSDPVKELAEFVATTEFDWDVKKVVVRVPNTLRLNNPDKTGELVLRIGSGEMARMYSFKPGAPRMDAAATTVEFTPIGEPVRYVPGEGFTATLTLTDKEGEYTLRWQDARTPAYRFEAFLREPTFEAAGPNPIPQRADGVRVTAITKEGEAFRVPLLLPATR